MYRIILLSPLYYKIYYKVCFQCLYLNEISQLHLFLQCRSTYEALIISMIPTCERGCKILVDACESRWQRGSQCSLSECIRCLNYYNGNDTISIVALPKPQPVKRILRNEQICSFCYLATMHFVHNQN